MRGFLTRLGPGPAHGRESPQPESYLAKDGTNRANGRDVTFLDGKQLFLGSSNTAAEGSAK